MLLRIAPTRTVSDVLKDFNTVFPFLKLEFFSSKAFDKQDFSPASVIPHSRKIGECQPALKQEADMDITEVMKVNELEKLFREQFGLNVLVYRRSGNLWLQTTMTDHWSLQKQNQHGRELSSTIVRPLINESGEEAN